MSANDIQHGGDHYKSKTLQPWDVIIAWDMGFLDGNALKYLARYRSKNGKQDLEKAIHYIQKLIEKEYPESKTVITPDGITGRINSLGDDKESVLRTKSTPARFYYTEGPAGAPANEPDPPKWVDDEPNKHETRNCNG